LIQSLRNKINSLQSQVNQKNGQINTLNQQKASLEAGIRSRDQRIAQLEAEGRKDDAEIQKLKTEKAALQTQLNQANQEISRLNTEIKSLTQQLAQANQTIEEQKQIIDQQKAQLTTLQTQKSALESELATLKKAGQATQAQVAVLTDQIKTLDTQIQNLLQNIEAMSVASIEALRQSYEARMEDLQDARAREVAAIQENNQLKYSQALEDKNSASKDLMDLKTEYDFMVTDLRIIRAQLAASTTAITQTNQEIESLQQRLDVLTATPAPTKAPIQWGTSLYVIVDADAWMNDGVLIVMAMNGTELVTEPFQYRDMRQVFVISSQGHLRCLDKTGYYVTAMDNCLVPTGSERPPDQNWSIRRVSGGHSSQYAFMSQSCGAFLVPNVNQVTLERMPQTEGWFVIPVGRMQGSMVETQAPAPTTPAPTTRPPELKSDDIPFTRPQNPTSPESYVGYEVETATVYLESMLPNVTVRPMDITQFSTTQLALDPNTVILAWRSFRVQDGDRATTKRIVETVLHSLQDTTVTVSPIPM